eukprot:g9716.t1
MACSRADFLALLLLVDLQGAPARTTFEKAQQAQPSTTASALPRPFGESPSAGMSLQPHSGPGVANGETRHRDEGPEARGGRRRSLRPGSKEQGHAPSASAEDAGVGEGGDGETEGVPFLDNVDNVGVEVGIDVRRRLGVASRILADGDADAAASAGAGAIAEAASIRSGDFASLRGQCNDGDSFTVTSAAIPVAGGCYSAVLGTNFGEGFFYSTDDDDKRLMYPKLITRDGESKYFWAAAAFGDFSGGSTPIDCLSMEPTTTYIHPAAVTWQCDVNGSGSLERITDEVFFAVCGCGTTATSGSSSGDLTPAPSLLEDTSSGVKIFTAAPTVPIPNTPFPTTIPTPARSASPPSSTIAPVTEREISGCGRRIGGSLAALGLGAGVYVWFGTVFGASLL